MSNSNSSSSGIGVCGLLGVLFVGLKLGGVITWSWWWVTLPFWGGLACLAVFFIGCGLLYLVCIIAESINKKTN
jgi:hypothetical protein